MEAIIGIGVLIILFVLMWHMDKKPKKVRWKAYIDEAGKVSMINGHIPEHRITQGGKFRRSPKYDYKY